MNIDVKEIENKNRIIDNAIVELKKKYVGVDEQIDEIMNNVRTWYCYPQLQTRPCVVNLWGMSGCSKTDSVRTIAKLLNLEEDLIYFNFADINERNAWDIENEIEENIGNNKSNRIIVYDEFQYAATLNKKKEEKDNKGALKPFWELLDTGILKKKPEVRVLFNIYKMYFVLKRILDKNYPIELVNGKWVNYQDYINDIDVHERNALLEVFSRCNERQPNKISDEGNQCGGGFENDSIVKDEALYLELNPWLVDNVIDMYNDIKGCKYDTDNVDMQKKIYSMSAIEAMNFFYDVYRIARKGYELNFKDSIVFVIGNLDEAYDVSFNVNPDMSPDQFHKITKKISVVDIKEALKERFRNEQIARLGNIHVIYPSFSSKSFKAIIKLYLEKYAAEVKENIGCKLKFDGSVNSIIYKEGVFPTQGTRPIFSTIQDIVKSRLPEIIKVLTETNKIEQTCTIEYSYSNGFIKMSAYDDNNEQLITTKSKLKLRVDNLRKSSCDDNQALCAVHESGHFVAYTSVYGKLPAKLMSMATESGTGGFLLHDTDEDDKAIKTAEYYNNNIKIALGGYAAETVVFGDHRTSGASSDLMKATSIASQMVMQLGMFSPVVKSALLNPDTKFLVVDDKRESMNLIVKNIIDKSLFELYELFEDKDYRKMLKESSLYLSTHSEMPRSKMKEMFSLIPAEKKKVIDDKFYRNTLKTFE